VLRRAGYEPVSRKISIAAPSRTIRETLTKLQPGVLVLTILPYADIYLNGTLVRSEQSRYEKRLDPGRYTVELRNPLLKDSTLVIDIESREIEERFIDLKEGRESQ